MVNCHVVQRVKIFSPYVILAGATWFLLTSCTPAPAPPATMQVTSTLTEAIRPIEETLKPTTTPTLSQPPSPAVPTPSPFLQTATAAPVCTESTGRYELHNLQVPELTYPLSLRVYLPPCYDANPSQHYPVLYLFHGFRYTDDQWQRLGVGETLENLLAAGELPPFIIVMPLDREGTEPDENPMDRLFIQKIIPMVDDTYRTLAERRYRAVGGLSRGAGWAVHFGLQNWETFGSVGAHSLALFWYDSRRIDQMVDAIPPDELPRFYLDMGRSDKQLDETLYSFLEVLDQRNVPHEWHLFRGYHDEAYWSSHLEYYIRWYSANWSDLIP